LGRLHGAMALGVPEKALSSRLAGIA
jgi:hypothetical protein